MRKEIKEKISNITLEIIETIARTPEALAGAFLDQKSLKHHLGQEKEFLSDKIVQHLWNLKRSGYIETKNIKGSASVRLTTKGKIKHLENSTNQEKDGKMRIISYDIPEEMNNKRQQFCRSLKRIGFRQLQKSLWICNYNKADQIDLIIDELKIKKFVAYFVVSKSNIDGYINKLLK